MLEEKKQKRRGGGKRGEVEKLEEWKKGKKKEREGEKNGLYLEQVKLQIYRTVSHAIKDYIYIFLFFFEPSFSFKGVIRKFLFHF